MNEELLERVERELLGWPGVSKEEMRGVAGMVRGSVELWLSFDQVVEPADPQRAGGGVDLNRVVDEESPAMLLIRVGNLGRGDAAAVLPVAEDADRQRLLRAGGEKLVQHIQACRCVERIASQQQQIGRLGVDEGEDDYHSGGVCYYAIFEVVKLLGVSGEDECH